MTMVIRTIMGIIILISIAFAGFNITNTSDWYSGTRSYSLSNWDIACYADNLNIWDGNLELDNKYSDRFTFDDADGITWKWVEDDFWGLVTTGNVTANIENSTYNVIMENTSSVPYGAYITRGLNQTVQSDVDMKIDIKMPYLDSGNNTEIYFNLWKEDDSIAYCYFGVYNDGSYWSLMYECTDDASTVLVSSSMPIKPLPGDMNLTLRIQRIGTTCNLYYHEENTEMWNWIDSTFDYGDCFSGESRPQIYADAMMTDDSAVMVTFDNFEMETPKETETRTIGNWTSENITIPPGNVIMNTTITFYNPNENTCIDKIQWLDSTGNVEAEYNASTCNATATTTWNETQENASSYSTSGNYDWETGYFSLSTSNAFDGDWDSYAASGTSNAYAYFKYTIPTGTVNATWHTYDGYFGEMWTDIPTSCMNGTDLNMQAQSYKYYASKKYWYVVSWACWETGTQSWNYLLNSNSTPSTYSSQGRLYEEQMIWSITESSAVINEENLTSGSFGAINNTLNFTVKMFLTGDGLLSPVIKEISGEYYTPTIYVFEYCSGNNTLTIEHKTNSYLGNDTITDLNFLPCALGCNNATNTCVDLTQATDYSCISIYALIASIVFLLIAFYISKSKIIRILFGILIALLLIVILSLAIEPSTLTNNAIIQQIGGTNVNFYFIISIIVVALVLLITLLAIANHFTNKKNKAYGIISEDDEDDDE